MCECEYINEYTINTRSNHGSIRSLIRCFSSGFVPVAHVYYIERHEIPIPNRNDITYDISKSILCAILHVYLYIHVSDHALQKCNLYSRCKSGHGKSDIKTNGHKRKKKKQSKPTTTNIKTKII